MNKRILFLSNGHGEDGIAATLIKELKKTSPNLTISALPVVGEGKALEGLGIEILGSRRALPSGGFIYHNLPNLLKDLSSGLLTNTFSQIGILRSLKGQFDLVVAIGDIVVMVGAVLTQTPFIFVGCAKSDYYDYSYTPWEKWLLKRYCKMAFPRDVLTTDNLRKEGIKAEFVGNPMMDAINPIGDLLGADPSSIVVGFLPGTREDAFLNLEDLVKVTRKVLDFKTGTKPVEFLVALAENLDAARALKLIPAELPVRIIQGKFAEVLNRSDIIVGLSGTGNEQAVGMGKPVVCFPGRGVQHTRKFAQDKKQLLGDSISLVDADPSIVAQEVWTIIKDPARQEAMREVGRERMGDKGAARKIAEFILHA
jgi:hypothetical protein